MAKLYERADIYDLMESEHRYKAFMGHWAEVLKGKNVNTLLDVSIGSGGVTIPLLDLGIRLFGSDLSESMLERCDQKIKAKGYEAQLQVCDFRNLCDKFSMRFDCVASTGNSLAYVTNEELLCVLEQMNELIRK